MPRDTTQLLGLQNATVQVPVTLILLDIPGDRMAICDLDISLWMNTTTGATSVKPAEGMQEFMPYPILKSPDITQDDANIVSDNSILLANVDQDFDRINNKGAYRDAAVTVWKGQLQVTAGAAPESATFVSPLKYYVARINTIFPIMDTDATIVLGPHVTTFTVMLPRRMVTREMFPNVPTPGTKINFGYTETEV
jgi:hypothetical protein